MKGLCAHLTTLFLSASAFAAVVVWLNVAAGLVTFSTAIVINGLILGGLLSAGASLLTTLFGHNNRNVLCYAFSMAFASSALLFTATHFNLNNELLIAYGVCGAIGFAAGAVGSGISRVIHGKD